MYRNITRKGETKIRLQYTYFTVPEARKTNHSLNHNILKLFNIHRVRINKQMLIGYPEIYM